RVYCAVGAPPKDSRRTRERIQETRTKDDAYHHAHEKGRHMSTPNDQPTTQTLPPEQPPTPPGQQPPSPDAAPPPAPTQAASPTAPGSPPGATPTPPRQRSPQSFFLGFLTAALLLGMIAAALYYLGPGQSLLPQTRVTTTVTTTATTQASTPTPAATATPVERIIYQDALTAS